MGETTGQPPATLTVTLQDLDRVSVVVSFDKTYEDGRRVVSLDFGDQHGSRVHFLDDLPVVAELIHRADVLLQARLAMAPTEAPA